jgi:hypothetical protein
MGMFLTSPSDLRFQALFAVVMVVLNHPLSYWLAVQLGSIGPIVGSIVCVGLIQAAPNYLRVRSSYRRGRALAPRNAISSEVIE